MPTDPQTRATQDVAVELKKLNRTAEALNANFVTFIQLLKNEIDPAEAEFRTTKPTPATFANYLGEKNASQSG